MSLYEKHSPEEIADHRGDVEREGESGHEGDGDESDGSDSEGGELGGSRRTVFLVASCVIF